MIKSTIKQIARRPPAQPQITCSSTYSNCFSYRDQKRNVGLTGEVASTDCSKFVVRLRYMIDKSNGECNVMHGRPHSITLKTSQIVSARLPKILRFKIRYWAVSSAGLPRG